MTDWIFNTMKMDMDTFRYFLITVYPFCHEMSESSVTDETKIRKMIHDQMDTDAFLFATTQFYQHIIRTGISLVDEKKGKVVEMFAGKIEVAGETMNNGEYVSTCNYLKKAMDRILEVSEAFDGDDIYVAKISSTCLFLRRVGPKTLIHHLNVETEEYNRVRTLMELK